MCTVSYIPKGKNQFILTSNRDESALRSPKNISSIPHLGTHLLFPRDTTAGGTWIAASGNDRVVCLLNGAFERHQHQPPYAKSRGIMVLDFFDSTSVTQFARNYDFQGMEAFTMIVAEQQQLYEIRWDEQQQHFRSLPPQETHFWSSTTLYPAEIRAKRASWFAQWLSENKLVDAEAILNFHKTAGEGDPENDLIMNRKGIVQTVSITSIVKGNRQIEMQYHDLIHSTIKKAAIKLQRESLEFH